MSASITLSSDLIEVVVTPERGADIVQLTDRRTGIPLLATSPTGAIDPEGVKIGGTQARWLAGYPGGWQLLVPNAGPEREHDGVLQGFHGEASLARWRVTEQTADSCTLETHLSTSPLRIRRTVTVDGGALRVTDAVTNLSPDPVEVRLVQHPAFGEAFLGDGGYLVTSAKTMVTDADAPGTLAAPDVVGEPAALLREGPVPNSVELPRSGSGASLFACLSDFAEPRATFVSPRHGIAVHVDWDGAVLPHAWFWIEVHASPGWPWFRRLYSIAVEPANVLPGDDGRPAGHLTRGGNGTRIEGGDTLTTTTTLTCEETAAPDAG